MTTINDILELFESVAPARLQENYDNSGLQVGKKDSNVESILLTLDATEDVVLEAEKMGCQLILAHHPLLFKGLKSITGASYVERTVELALKKEIAILAIHTNLDNIKGGVNKIISDIIGLQNQEILSPGEPVHLGEPTGAGMTGELNHEISEDAFLKLVKSKFRAQAVRHSPKTGRGIKKIAVCGGAGSFLLKTAIRNRADAFLTGDFKYHEFFDAEGKILIADPGHYETEQFTVQLFNQLISEKFPNIALHFSEVRTNPIYYA